MQWLIENVWLVPIYPLIGFLLILLGRAFGNTASAKLLPAQSFHDDHHDEDPSKFPRILCMLLTVGATLMGLCHSVAALNWLFAQGADHVVAIEKNWVWLQAGSLSLSVGYLLDSMSVMMLFVVTFISLLIQIYTHGYMSHDKGYSKFYAFLALFNFSMLGLVLSTNLFQIYIFWELVGVSSYLLIGFWLYKASAAKAAIKAFLMNRVGDLGFLIGILTFLFFSFTWWQEYLIQNPSQAFLSFQSLGPAAFHVMSKAGPEAFALMAILIFSGPMAKSAQVPLHTWLPDAMEGPTPISALIHAATMVAAGVFLVGRVYPIFELSTGAMSFVAFIGIATAVIGATIALTQTDIKKALAYSTMSQLGFMMTAMGIGAFSAGLFHLFTHAFFKAMLFLCSGSVIHACENEQDMRKMGGLFSKLPVTGLTYLIGTLAISGLFWTSGFWSKDEILVAASNNPLMFWVLAGTAGLTSFYMFRTFFMTFIGSYRGQAHVHKESAVMVLPLAVLAIPSLAIGALLSGVFPEVHSFASFIHYTPVNVTHAAAHGHHVGFFTPVGNISMLVGLSGLVLAALFYGPKPVFNPDWFVKFPLTQPLYSLFCNKWYFDELYQGFVNKVYLVFASLSAAFDRYIIDGLVNFAGRSILSTGYGIRQLQSGKVQTYVAVIFFSVVTLSLLFTLGLL